MHTLSPPYHVHTNHVHTDHLHTYHLPQPNLSNVKFPSKVRQHSKRGGGQLTPWCCTVTAEVIPKGSELLVYSYGKVYDAAHVHHEEVAHPSHFKIRVHYQ